MLTSSVSRIIVMSYLQILRGLPFLAVHWEHNLLSYPCIGISRYFLSLLSYMYIGVYTGQIFWALSHFCSENNIISREPQNC